MSSVCPKHEDVKPGAAGLDRYQAALAALALPAFAARVADEPFVAAIEGPNAAGKSTLSRALADALGAPLRLGIDPAWFSEPFRVRMIRDAAWYASAMFFLSGCCEQMRVVCQARDPLVIMDRSLWSTLAVHAAAGADRLAALLAMLRPLAAELRVPDMTIVLTASFAACRARMAAKTGAARVLDELTATADFHAREQEFYRWLGRQRPEVVFLDVEKETAAACAAQAAALIRKARPC